MKTVSARDANQAFSKLLAAAAAGEEIVITRRGKPVARLGPFSDEAEIRAQKRAADRTVKRLRRGVHFGGLRATREDMHER